jgi:hypothetical protein
MLAGALLLWMASEAVAGPATDQLRGSIDAVLKILSDPELKKETKIGAPASDPGRGQ